MTRHAAILSALMALAAHGSAAGETAALAGADTLTGGWDNRRQMLVDAGVTLEGGYKADFLRLTSGGLRRGGRPLGHLDLKMTADLEKLAGWSGTTVFINYLHDHGETINADRVGSVVGVSNIEVPVDTHRFFHAWVQKEWSDGRISLLGGLYPIDSEFQVLDSGAIFVQPPYGPTADLSLTRGPSIFNTSAVGLRGKWLAEDRALYAQAAILDGIPGDPDRPKGTHVRFGKDDGTMTIVEFGFKPGAAKGQIDEPRIAKIAMGAWGYSKKADDQMDVDGNGSPLPRRSRGAYVLAERGLWQSAAGLALNGFVRYSATDGDSTPIETALNLGLFVKAPFANRPDDTGGIGYTRVGMSDKYRAAQLIAGAPATSSETTWEVTYRAAAMPWFFVQPLVQFYRNPGADAAVDKATVAGVRFEVVF